MQNKARTDAKQSRIIWCCFAKNVVTLLPIDVYLKLLKQYE